MDEENKIPSAPESGAGTAVPPLDDGTKTLPLMALRGLTIFPDMVMSFDVEREQSLASLAAAAEGDRSIFLTTQKDVLKEYPGKDDLYGMGVMCILRQFIKTQNGGMRVMMEGRKRARLLSVDNSGKFASARVLPLDPNRADASGTEAEAQLRNAVSLFEEYVQLTGNTIPETIIGLALKSDPGYVADYIAQNSFLKYTQKQEILETLEPFARLKAVSAMLTKEIEILKIEREINDKLREQLGRTQRDNVLREQIRVIQNELGDDDGSDVDEYGRKIRELHLSKETEEKLLKETERLAKQPFGSAETAVIRGYLDTVLELPWNKTTKERTDVAAARRILDRDHYGLDKVKERIIEFIAVRQLAPDVKGGILCLVGPPGVGKTSVAISIAHAMNRKLARMSLGGVHDEAEIRGHRKTYIGAMPGRIMTAVAQSGSRNPLLLLDEIDKLGSDYRGDPSSALLEALDPEQNATFRDHYLEVPFDLSQVLFITTANTTETIPRPLLDRMELIELPSYTDEEKLQIAKSHLIPKQRKKHGLDARRLRIGDGAVREIISGWTRESGVRELEREIAAICRKTDAKIAAGELKSLEVKSDMLPQLLGVRKFKPEELAGKSEVGVVNGLAWTSAGGEMLEVEAVAMDGTGKLELTGNLGDVMKESAQAAVSYIRSRCDKLGIDREFYKNKDIHIHFPEGAVPKDGPSAGVTITVAVVSALTGAPVRRDLAMTGEITLTGRVLPIGGLREKTMAALRYGIKTVLIPAENEPDLDEIDQTVRRALSFVTVRHADEVLGAALELPAGSPADGKNFAPKPSKTEGGRASIRQ